MSYNVVDGGFGVDVTVGGRLVCDGKTLYVVGVRDFITFDDGVGNCVVGDVTGNITFLRT